MGGPWARLVPALLCVALAFSAVSSHAQMAPAAGAPPSPTHRAPSRPPATVPAPTATPGPSSERPPSPAPSSGQGPSSEQPPTEQAAPTDEPAPYNPLDTYSFYLTALFMAFGLVVILLQLAAMRRIPNITADEIARNCAITLVVVASVALLVSGYSSQQVAPAFGLFGTIIGYLLGKAGAKETRPRDPEPREPQP